jgi:hypothetical protein
MFIGHFGVAFAAKRVAPRTSLGILILGAQFLDFTWPIFLLLGIEHVRIAPGITRVSPLDFYDYPISHSLLMAAVWSAVVGGTYYRARRYGRGALVVGEPHNDVVSARQRLVNGKTSRPGGTIMPLVITAHHHAAQSGPTRKHTSHNFSVRQLCRLRSAPLDTPENVTISSRVTLYSVTNMGIIRAMRS